MNIPWWGYVILAGLSWGTYVPIIFFGGSELGGKPNARLMAILCVGIAYFVLAVIFPLVLFLTGQQEWPTLKPTGLIFAGLAGVAGAVGAICVIFASKAAMQEGIDDWTATEKNRIEAVEKAESPSAKEEAEAELAEWRKEKPSLIAKYRIFIAPLIFGLAPLINVLLSSVWDPKPDNAFNIEVVIPGWKLLLGIGLVAVGTFLVLFSKEENELNKGGHKPPPAAVNKTEPTKN